MAKDKCVICGGKLTHAHGNVCGKCWDKFNIEKQDKDKKELGPEQLLLEIEKLRSKIEVMEDFRSQFGDRFSKLSEEIGDLRRMVLDREQEQKEMVAGFEKVKATVEEIEPTKITKRFEKLRGDLEKNTAQTEKNQKLFEKIRGELEENREILSKVKGLENLVNISNKIEERANKIKKSEAYTERLASKVENIFTELSEKLTQMKTRLETVDKLDNLSKDMLKEVDRLKLKFEEDVAQMSDLKELEKSVDERLEKAKKTLPQGMRKEFDRKKEELNQKQKDIEKRLKEFSTTLKEVEKNITSNRMGLDKLKEKTERIDKESKSLEELEEERENMIQLLDRAKKDYKSGSLSLEAYKDVTRANRKRLKIIDSILERVSRESLYKKIKETKERVDKLLDSRENLVRKDMLDNVMSTVTQLREKVNSLEDIREKFIPIKESSSIMTDRIETLEDRLEKLKERKREVNQLQRKMDQLNRMLSENKKLLSRDEKKTAENRERVENLSGKLDQTLSKVFSLEKNDDEMLHLINNLTPPDVSELSERMKELRDKVHSLEEETATEEEVTQLKQSFEEVVNKNTRIIEKILEEMGA